MIIPYKLNYGSLRLCRYVNIVGNVETTEVKGMQVTRPVVSVVVMQTLEQQCDCCIACYHFISSQCQ